MIGSKCSECDGVDHHYDDCPSAPKGPTADEQLAQAVADAAVAPLLVDDFGAIEFRPIVYSAGAVFGGRSWRLRIEPWAVERRDDFAWGWSISSGPVSCCGRALTLETAKADALAALAKLVGVHGSVTA